MSKIITFSLLLLCLLAGTFAQDAHVLSEEDLNDPELLKLLNNYFGCKTWEDGVCVECSDHYYFNNNGICCEVKPECKIFDREQGVCVACYQGWMINEDGVCQVVDLANSDQAGCKAWENGNCIECSHRWVFNADGVCVPVDDLCAAYDENGACTECYKGYHLEGAACVRDEVVGPSDLGCKTWDWDNQECLACSHRWVFNADGVCVPVDDFCAAHDNTGACTECYKGYHLEGAACVRDEVVGPTDLGCKTWDWDNQVCLECSQRWVFNADGVCVPVDDFCAAHDNTGACTECYKGYHLEGAACVRDEVVGPTDLGCKTWDWDNQVCLECSQRWVFNADGVCVPVDDFCAAHDNTGACTECYKGYHLEGAACVRDEVVGPTDLGCKTWDWDNQVCLECSQRWVFNADGVCVPVDDFCAAHDNTGACTECYKGYHLEGAACVRDEVVGPTDLGCKTWDWDNQVCLECSQRWVFNADGVCVPVDDFCAAHDNTGACTECYKGYHLEGAACVRDEVVGPTDLGCKTWDWDNQVCLECSQRWVFNADGVCVPVDDFCAAHDNTGACTECYKGYHLEGAACVRDEVVGPTDLGCKTWDWDNQVCLECSQRWVFNADGVCVPVDDFCAAHDNTGACTECYKGYHLEGAACVRDEVVGPTDLGCKTWDWDNQVCLECSQRWVFNADGVCVPVDDFCAAHDNTGACTECYKGYHLEGAACVRDEVVGPTDLGCKTWDWDNQVCLECSQRWVFNADGVCVPVDDFCAAHDNTGACTECYKGYHLEGAACVRDEVVGPTDLGCKTWDWDNQVCLECSQRWVFNADGVCVPVDDFCAAHDNTGACTECYKGYHLEGAACVRDEVVGPTDLGCKTWDWDNQVCLECSQRWVFNADGVCVPVDDFCAAHDNTGACTECYKGYHLEGAACVRDEVVGPTDLGCKTWDWDNQVCLECSQRWVFNADGVCVPVDDFCAAHDNTGACTECYKGYHLEGAACVRDEVVGPTDLGCKTWDWDNQVCLECSQRWVFNADGVCVPVDDFCAAHDNTGACTECYKGYHLEGAACVLDEVVGPSDLGCKTWDWDNQVCLECSQRWVFNADGVCVPVDDFCAAHDNTGACTECYKGYHLEGAACVRDEVVGPTDLGCKTWDWDNQVCLECSQRWVFNADGVCVPVDDFCAAHDNTGACTECYKGYHLEGAACVRDEVVGPSDLGCKTWDWDNQVCLECSQRWVFNADGVCVPVDDFCAAHDNTGACTECYKGYHLEGAACVRDEVVGPTDLGCKTWDWDNQVCLECSQRWVFNADGVCVPVDDFCAAHDNTGACTECYKGYHLEGAACVLDEVVGPSDLGCKTWDWDNQVCLECSQRWVFNADGVCVPVDDFCAAHDNTGACTECYKGYHLEGAACVRDEVVGPTDLGCKTWDWDNQVCLECSQRWVFNADGVCVPVDDFCAAHDNTGACTECYKGYHLEGAACVLDEVVGPSDLGCKTWDWDNQVCLECSQRWVFNADGVCVPVDDFCAAHDNTGACTECYVGYLLTDGVCNVHNVLCKGVAADGTCTSCFSGYVLYKQECLPLSKLADIYLYYAECCPQKLAELQNSA